ncbi:MAG: hypothetical protein HY291_17825 [Planctomycetes bacterium]|nr:hypothetical protein [Planctomycetota bacterium]
MELTILNIIDETPKGLTTGFRLKLNCEANGATFMLDLPILIGKEVLAQKVPLPDLAIAYLKKNGLESYPDLFVDSRRIDLTTLGTAPAFPLKITLGGMDVLNQKALEKLGKK